MNPDTSFKSAFNYYKVGGSLSPEHPSYVKRQADTELYESLKNGDFCCVFNSRQMGKSSLRVQVTKKLAEEGIKCTSIDMTTIGSSEQIAENFYADITFELWSAFLDDISNFYPWWKEHQLLSPLQRLSQFIDKVLLITITQNIVIFIDEIDNLINRKAKDEFLEFIRACYNQRADKLQYKRITFCLLGVVTPSDLKDKKGIPFNIGKTIELAGFSLEEAQQSLTKGLVQKVDAPEVVLQEILSWTGGQPFLTQKLCKLILEKGENAKLNIDDIVENYIVKNWEFYDDPEHLRTIKNRLLIGKISAYNRLKIYQQILHEQHIDADDSTEQISLRLSGLVVKQQSKLKVCNKIYENVFNQSWVEKNLATLPQLLDVDVNTELKSSNILNYSLLVPIALILAIISSISLGFSYIVVESQPWNQAYNSSNIGAILECLRVCFLLTLEVYVICSEFSQEAIQLIQEKRLYLRRRVTCLVGFIFCLMLVFHHFWYGPHQLLGNSQVTTEEYFHQYLIPYIWYFPYSIVNFIVIGVPLSSLSIHVVIEDCNKLRIKIKKYKNYLTQVTNEISLLSYIDNNEIIQQFKQIYWYFYEKINRPLNLLLGIVILIYFDATFSKSTLSHSAYFWTQLFCIFGFMTPAIVLILWGLLAYRKSREDTIGVLFNFNCDFTEIESQYSTFNLLKKIVRSNIFLITICIICCLQIIYTIFKF
ncbi:AAA-like domain-containing protein [Aulosira sp. FACHB-615]|uniref:AAA-like domain-containing protein n=1 Tax=Aulosira sp. FACHB-615 TaxID=2692777 RepID=UPI001685BE61|nr:AAA-like domain-containing protein [Aulosira sp. FACHB-615]MBD2492381.1 AAA-like domain-containing protein [Aulosira sp. FACHB-615]